MISTPILRVIIAGALLLHAIAHAIALAALVAQSMGRASRLPIRPWILPSLPLKTAALLAMPFWTLSAAGFVLASVSFWGVLLSGEDWRLLALAAAGLSILGIVLFAGKWPGSPNARRSVLNTAIALAMNLVILVTQLWLRWPAVALFGK